MKGTKPILKKPTEAKKRPSSVGHHSSRSESSDADRPLSLNKKRLSWGPSKVLEFYANKEKKDEQDESKANIRDPNARRSVQIKSNSELSPKVSKYINVVNEYQVDLSD
jgi:hypothetical protein